MTNYLQRDAELIQRCLPAGVSTPDDSGGLLLIYAVLMRVKGTETTASDVHDAWSAWMLGVEPDHESIRPFRELDAETRKEDGPFLAAIRRAAELRG